MDPQTQDVIHGNTDTLESVARAAADSAGAPRDSPSSAIDAGLDDETLDEAGFKNALTAGLEADIDDDGEFDAEGDDSEEIPFSDMHGAGPSRIHSGELDDMSSPGELDIEDLDEDALDDTNLPADARLDPLED